MNDTIVPIKAHTSYKTHLPFMFSIRFFVILVEQADKNRCVTFTGLSHAMIQNFIGKIDLFSTSRKFIIILQLTIHNFF